MNIRDAEDADRDAIRDVTLSAYEEYAAAMPPPLWEGYRQSMVDTLADVRPAAQIVAEQDGGIIGTVLLYPAGSMLNTPDGATITRRWPEVRLLAVAPPARGRGVGAALMDECVRRARLSGAGALTLHTADIMRVAMRMYERMGFVRAPELDFHPAPGQTVKGYRLELDAPSL